MLDSMARLERFKGHFYNWYDTQTLKPLPPLYVSSVDSGNLAALLLTLRPGLLEMADTSLLDRRLTQGLLDTFDTLLAAYARTSADTQPITALREQVRLAHGQVGDVYATLLPMLVEQLQPLITQRAALAPGTEAADDCTFWLNA